MGVIEIVPGLYWSSITTDDRASEIDLGCYTEKGPAGVAHDLMVFKFNSASGEQRRLPQVEDENLYLSLSEYERVARDIIKELKRSVEDLAVALKSKGLAERLHNLIEHGGTPKHAAAPAAAQAQPGGYHAAEPTSRKVLPSFGKSPEEAPESPSKDSEETEEEEKEEEKTEEEQPAAKKKKTEKKPKNPTAAKEAAPSEAPSQTTLVKLWIKTNPEWPPNSGKYPCYAKEKPLKHGYITVAQAVCKALLPDAVHGNIEIVSVDDPEQTWNAAYTVKEAEHRVPGNFKGSRYFTQIAALRKGLDLKEGDVLVFSKADEPQQVKLGLWRKGSAEAEAFTKDLINDQSKK